MTSAGSIARRAAEVVARIENAAQRAGRSPSDVRLVAVTKKFPPETIRAALDAGITDLGENRVQEAASKIDVVPRATWHMIGHLQRNKARAAVEIFDLVHTVDSAKLGEMLGRLGCERGADVHALVQVALGDESSKSGVAPELLDELLDTLAAVQGLRIEGLMCIPPFLEPSERVRRYFAQLRELAGRIESRRLEGVTMRQLSMGMSHDFEVAVAEGATLVRVGSAVFGPRPG